MIVAQLGPKKNSKKKIKQMFYMRNTPIPADYINVIYQCAYNLQIVTAAPATLLASIRPNSPLFSDNSSQKSASSAPDATRCFYSDSICIPVVTSNKNKDVNTTSSESSDSDQDKDPCDWTTVQQKHCGVKNSTSKERSSYKDISSDVNSVLAKAKKSLMNTEKHEGSSQAEDNEYKPIWRVATS